MRLVLSVYLKRSLDKHTFEEITDEDAKIAV